MLPKKKHKQKWMEKNELLDPFLHKKTDENI